MHLTRRRPVLLVAAALTGLLAPALAQATPGAPSLTSPLSGTRLPAFGTTLTWQLLESSTQYQLQVTPAGNDGPAVNVIRNYEGQFQIPSPPTWYGLLPDMTYSWHVRATDKVNTAFETDSSWGIWAPTWTFRTPAVTSEGIREVFPATGSTGIGIDSTRIQWQAPNPSIFYFEVQASTDAQFNTDPETAAAAVWSNLIHGGLGSPANSWQMPRLQPNTTYYWRVRPRVQGDGMPVEWSRTFSFTTGSG